MDPLYEQKLRDEVIYLHSLWHQGPPLNPNPRIQTPLIQLRPSNPPQFKKDSTKIKRLNPNPRIQTPLIQLRPSNPPQFKKDSTKIKRKGKFGKKMGKKALQGPDPRWVSDLEWPCKEPVESPSTWPNGWPALNIPVAKVTKLPSPEEHARFLATQLQEKPLKAAQEFFKENENDDEDDSMDDEDDDDDEDENKVYDFFLKLIMGDGELKGYYEKNWGSGDFCCLVCGGIREKIGKKFKNCVALVQHSVSIARTKRKLAHRAYADVICKVLSWNIDRLPSIVLPLADPLGSSLSEPGNVQGNAGVAVEGSENLNSAKDSVQVSEDVNSCGTALKAVSLVIHEEELVNSCAPGLPNIAGDNSMLCEEVELLSSVPGSDIIAGDSLMVCETTSHGDDSNKYVENANNGISVTKTGQTEGTVNRLCRNIEKTMVLETK